MTAIRQDRSMVEPVIIGALDIYINQGTRNERRLAEILKDMIQLTGDHPTVVSYLNKWVGEAADT